MVMGNLSEISGKLGQTAPYVNRSFSLAKLVDDVYPTRKFSKAEIAEFHRKLMAEDVSIELADVRVQYPSEIGGTIVQKTCLEIDNLKIAEGEKIGLVGERGAGKSTLIQLLLGITSPSEGSVNIRVGEELYNLEEIPLEAWWAITGYSPQDGYVGRSLKVMERILLGINEFKNEALTIEKVMEMTGASDFIDVEQAKNMYINLMGAKSRKFSGGETHSLINCAALIGNQTIYILDEPTARLDAINEAKLIDELAKMENKLCILITHRLKNLRKLPNARIIVLNEGQIVADGNHSDLIQKEGLYTVLYNMQDK